MHRPLKFVGRLYIVPEGDEANGECTLILVGSTPQPTDKTIDQCNDTASACLLPDPRQATLFKRMIVEKVRWVRCVRNRAWTCFVAVGAAVSSNTNQGSKRDRYLFVSAAAGLLLSSTKQFPPKRGFHNSSGHPHQHPPRRRRLMVSHGSQPSPSSMGPD